MSEKVTITITPDEIVTLVEIEGKTIKQRQKMLSAGQSQTVEGPSDWMSEIDDEDLAAAVDDLDFGPFGVAGSLWRRADAGFSVD